MDKKTCTHCKIERDISYFYYNTHHHKHESVCKECGIIRCREWRRNNPTKAKLSSKTSKQRQKQSYPLLARTLQLASSMTSHAKKKSLQKCLSANDLRDLYNKQNGKCYYTGAEMELDGSHRDLFLMSADRIDSTKGYIPGNVVLCCWGINALKGTHSQEVLYSTLQQFYEGANLMGKIKKPDNEARPNEETSEQIMLPL